MNGERGYKGLKKQLGSIFMLTASVFTFYNEQVPDFWEVRLGPLSLLPSVRGDVCQLYSSHGPSNSLRHIHAFKGHP